MQTQRQSAGIRPAPDFEGRYKKVVLRQGEPDRVPLGDFQVDAIVKRELLRRELGWEVPIQVNRQRVGEMSKLPLDADVEFWYRAGFDYIPITAGLRHETDTIARTQHVGRATYAATGDAEQERGWVSHDQGSIATMRDFESYPWPDPERFDYRVYEDVQQYLRPGMKVLLGLGMVYTGVWLLMGMEGLARATRKDPDLIKALFEKVGAIQYRVLDIATRFESVGGVLHGDDIAYTEGTMVNPKLLREHFFPWMKAAAQLVHSRGLPFIYHSDGDLTRVLDDLVACGVDAVHPMEPKAMDIVRVKQTYGDRLAVMGNIDLSYTLTQGTPEEVDAEVKLRIQQLAPGGGYACASSNSIPEYVPFENFIAMRDAVFKYGKYPIQLD